VVIPCRRFETTYRSHLQGSKSPRPIPDEIENLRTTQNGSQLFSVVSFWNNHIFQSSHFIQLAYQVTSAASVV